METQNVFLDNDFISGEIILPSLEIDIVLPDNHYFRYDSPQNSRADIYNQILPYPLRREMRDVDFTKKFHPSYRMGFNLGTEGVGHLIYVRNLGATMNVFNEAFQCAEMAWNLGKEPRDRLCDYAWEQGYSLSPTFVLARDTVGIIFGILALQAHKFEIPSLIMDEMGEQVIRGYKLLSLFRGIKGD